MSQAHTATGTPRRAYQRQSADPNWPSGMRRHGRIWHQRTSDSFSFCLFSSSAFLSSFPFSLPPQGALSQCGGLYLISHIHLRNQASGILLPLLWTGVKRYVYSTLDGWAIPDPPDPMLTFNIRTTMSPSIPLRLSTHWRISCLCGWVSEVFLVVGAINMTRSSQSLSGDTS